MRYEKDWEGLFAVGFLILAITGSTMMTCATLCLLKRYFLN